MGVLSGSTKALLSKRGAIPDTRLEEQGRPVEISEPLGFSVIRHWAIAGAGISNKAASSPVQALILKQRIVSTILGNRHGESFTSLGFHRMWIGFTRRLEMFLMIENDGESVCASHRIDKYVIITGSEEAIFWQ